MRRLRNALDSAVFWRSFALVNIALYCALWVVAEFTGWINDTGFISRLSLLALILASLSWWQSSRVEVRQERDADVQEVLDLLRKLINDKEGAGNGRSA